MQHVEKINIIVADTRAEERESIASMLGRPGLTILEAADSRAALKMTRDNEIALVVMDSGFEGEDGLFAEQLQCSECENALPVIFISDAGFPENKIKWADAANAIDYLTKPLDANIFKRKVDTFLALYRQKKDLERTSRELLRKVAELKKSKAIIEKQNQKLNELVVRDSLTGLYNRHHLQNVLSREFERARRYHTDLACLMMDLDFFKQINDYFGHACGDYVLREFSACLARFTRKADIAFRYGGEEFLLLMPHTDIQGAQARADSIRKWSEGRIYKDGERKISVTVSIGIATLGAHQPKRPMDLPAFADKALYQAKAAGRNRVKRYLDTFLEDNGHSGDSDGREKDYQYLKERLIAVLEKTKKASMESLELLIKELGGDRFKAHNRRVMQYINMFTDKLGLAGAVTESLKRVAIFHECFRVLLSDAILSKSAHLTVEERREIEAHPGRLAELTELFNFFAEEREVLLHHHENFDGTGYPKGLTGEQIPMGARLFAIVDAMVAMTSERPYRRKMSLEAAITELKSKAGVQFDPELVQIAESVIKGLPEETR